MPAVTTASPQLLDLCPIESQFSLLLWHCVLIDNLFSSSFRAGVLLFCVGEKNSGFSRSCGEQGGHRTVLVGRGRKWQLRW